MIENILQKSKDNKSLVEFNCYNSSNGFFCGYVLDFNEDFVIIQHYSKFGVSDGLLTQKIANLKYFETDTNYLRGLSILIQNQEKMLKQSFSVSRSNDLLDNFTNLFERLIGNKEHLIKFELNDEEIYFGFLEWCDENNFSIINIDNDGINVGKATFKFEDLKAYWIDDLECRRRMLVYLGRNARR